jgi:hypothetical protein
MRKTSEDVEGTSRTGWGASGADAHTQRQMPNKFRYEFWNEDHYQKDYIPADANVARFLYTEGSSRYAAWTWMR